VTTNKQHLCLAKVASPNLKRNHFIEQLNTVSERMQSDLFFSKITYERADALFSGV
jgi:hypothetical protein